MITGEMIESLPVELATRINDLVILFKALGILAIVYIVWLIIKGIFTLRTYRKIDEIYEDIKKIKKKILKRNK